jgi:hypothetical protein
LVPDDIEPGDTALLTFAPGYPIYLAAVYRFLGTSYFTVQIVQNVITAMIPVALFLLAGQLISWRVGIVAGLSAAVTHATAYYSNLILPDSLAALPIIAAIYCFVVARRRLGCAYWPYLVAGVMLGLSVWLRPNSMMLAPYLFVYLATMFRWRRAVVWRCAMMIAAAVLIITPIAIRNRSLYGRFLPLQIGTGLNLWEGIGEASGNGFGAVSKDDEVGRQEIALYGDPRYLWWATPDGIERDQDRINKSLRIIRSHPLWYAGVIIGRVTQMVNYSASAPMVKTAAAQAEPWITQSTRDSPETRTEARLFRAGQEASRAALMPGLKLAMIRWPVKALQRLVRETSLVLLLLGGGALLLLSPRRWLFIAAVPGYYMLFQSTLHTEFRYTLPMQYFLFTFAATGWVAAAHWAYASLLRGLEMLSRKKTPKALE